MEIPLGAEEESPFLLDFSPTGDIFLSQEVVDVPTFSNTPDKVGTDSSDLLQLSPQSPVEEGDDICLSNEGTCSSSSSDNETGLNYEECSNEEFEPDIPSPKPETPPANRRGQKRVVPEYLKQDETYDSESSSESATDIQEECGEEWSANELLPEDNSDSSWEPAPKKSKKKSTPPSRKSKRVSRKPSSKFKEFETKLSENCSGDEEMQMEIPVRPKAVQKKSTVSGLPSSKCRLSGNKCHENSSDGEEMNSTHSMSSGNMSAQPKSLKVGNAEYGTPLILSEENSLPEKNTSSTKASLLSSATFSNVKDYGNEFPENFMDNEETVSVVSKSAQNVLNTANINLHSANEETIRDQEQRQILSGDTQEGLSVGSSSSLNAMKSCFVRIEKLSETAIAKVAGKLKSGLGGGAQRLKWGQKKFAFKDSDLADQDSCISKSAFKLGSHSEQQLKAAKMAVHAGGEVSWVARAFRIKTSTLMFMTRQSRLRKERQQKIDLVAQKDPETKSAPAAGQTENSNYEATIRQETRPPNSAVVGVLHHSLYLYGPEEKALVRFCESFNKRNIKITAALIQLIGKEIVVRRNESPDIPAPSLNESWCHWFSLRHPQVKIVIDDNDEETGQGDSTTTQEQFISAYFAFLKYEEAKARVQRQQ